MAVMLLVAGTKTWTARARVHPLRAELMWAGGLAAEAGALVLVASGRRRRAGAAEPEPV